MSSWHDASGERSAALDHTWLSPEMGAVLRSTYHWFAECQLDHAMMITQLSRQAWAPLLEVTALDQIDDSQNQEDLPIDFSKWADKEAVWRTDLDLQLQANHSHLQSIMDPFEQYEAIVALAMGCWSLDGRQPQPTCGASPLPFPTQSYSRGRQGALVKNSSTWR